MKKTPVGLHEPSFGGNEWRYVKSCLDSGWVSSAGKFVDRFEADVARRLGVKHAVAVVNGTSALHLALLALGVGRNDEVLVPSLTFIATANSIVYQGAVPRFIDVEESTFGLDPDQVARFLRKKCRMRGKIPFCRETGRRIAACLPMHALGHPVRMDALMKACGEYGIPVIEDAAEALGSCYDGRAAGSFGALGILSFNGNKIVTTGGGGMLVTDDSRLAARARHLSTQAKSDAKAFWHDEVGYNYRLPNVNAAIGCAQLEQLDGFVEKKRRIARWYAEKLSGAKGLRPLMEPPKARSNYWLNTVVAASAGRAASALKALNRAGYDARPLWAPCHKQLRLKNFPRENLSVSERLWRTSFNVPSSAGLSRKDIQAVSRIVLES